MNGVIFIFGDYIWVKRVKKKQYDMFITYTRTCCSINNLGGEFGEGGMIGSKNNEPNSNT